MFGLGKIIRKTALVLGAVAVAALVLAHLTEKAAALKAENDLTV